MLRFNTSSRGCIGFTVDHETNLESKWIPIQQDNSTNPIKSNFQAVMTNVILQTTLSRVAGMRTQNIPLSYLQLGEHHDCQHASVFLIDVIMLLAQASTIEFTQSYTLFLLMAHLPHLVYHGTVVVIVTELRHVSTSST